LATTTTDALRERLTSFVAARFPAGSRLAGVDIMEDGHAGLTFGFSVVPPGGTAAPQAFVIKLAPSGVRRSGNTDVYRQAPLLEALHRAGLPVPPVSFAAPDEAEFGVPYIVMPRLPGRTFVIWEPHASFAADIVPSLWRQTATALAAIHAFDWRAQLPAWEAPRPLAGELGRWDRIMRQAPDPAWIALGERLGAALAAAVPADGPAGIVHGDYQPGNALFDGGRLVAILDWELAGIGDQRIDLGWLSMMADPPGWADGWQPVAPVPPAELVALYEAASGRPAGDVRWFHAFANYRMGSIGCLNVKLHRKGQRPDPLWERFAGSIPTLFRRGLDLLGRPG
jgi:aminoglycoside phosphotransferase (APT) family kinase protein